MSKASESMERFITRIIQLSDSQFVEFFKNVPSGGIKIRLEHMLRGEIDEGSEYEFIILPMEKKPS